MLLYFYLLGAAFFRDRMRPALAESRRLRSFVPCRDLCDHILQRSATQPPADCVLRQVIHDLRFTHEFWHALIGELLVFGCDDMPGVQTAADTLCCLLAPQHRA